MEIKMKNMRKLLIVILVLASVLSLCACGGGKAEMNPAAFTEELLANAKFTDSLDRLADPVVPLLYGVDEADYTDAIVYCGTAATAEEVAVFTAKDSAAAGRILSACQARVAKQIETYKDYGPAAAMLLEDAIVKQSGNYVVVVVCTDTDGAAKIADKYL